MVASDTVVGLVGAGILLVALVGVFVYESQQGGIETPELTNADYAVTGKGNVATTAQDGDPAPVTGACVSPACTPASTNVNLEFTGLPDPGSLKYVVFLTGGGSPYNVGALSKSGEKWTLSKTDTSDQSGKTLVVVSLEKTASATSPSWIIISFNKGSVPATPEDVWLRDTGNHTLSLTPTGNQLNVSATIDDVPAKSGLVYRGWLKAESASGTVFTFVGNFTHAAATDEHAEGEEDLVLAMNVPGSTSSYNEFWVTIESEGGAIGEKPAGPAVITAMYNPFTGSVAEP